MQQNKWDKFFLQTAFNVANTFSKDAHRKVGAVIYRESYPLSFGYNGFIRGFPDDILLLQDKDKKLIYTEHAERNAIFNASRNNINIMEASIACTFHPCHECARAIIQSGLKRVICPAISEEDKEGRWFSSITEAQRMFTTCGVDVIILSFEQIEGVQ